MEQKYKYLQTLDCFEILKEKCSTEELDELEEEMRWYEEDATDDDIGECGENLSNFLVFVYGSDNYWFECLMDDCVA